MTARPNPLEFTALQAQVDVGHVGLHPNIEECYWGYELRMNETALSLAVIWRALAGFGSIVALIAALGVLMMSAGAGITTLLISGLFVAVAVACANTGRRDTQVRVQIDTRNGELREVVDGRLGKVDVLAQYGLDAVRAVRLVGSGADNGFGQIHAEVEGYGSIPLADGAIAPLRALRDRIAADCGLETGHRREAEWSGPLIR